MPSSNNGPLIYACTHIPNVCKTAKVVTASDSTCRLMAGSSLITIDECVLNL